MPGKPAARMGDTALDCADPVDTPTGTVIAAGNVFINKMPAAKQGDQILGTDIHIILIPSPTGPVPTPLPHPFAGMINGGTVPTVKIMGMPAAVLGSTATNMPPHIPQGGAFQLPPKNQAKIITGSANVFIGTGSGGGGGGGSGSVGSKSDGIFNRSFETSDVNVAEGEGHFIDLDFEDGGGVPVVGTGYGMTDADDETGDGLLSGPIKRRQINEGEGSVLLRDITKVAWSGSEDLTAGETVSLQIETVGIVDGAEVTFKVFERDTERLDKCLACIKGQTVKGDKAEAPWKYQVRDITTSSSPENYSDPKYYFTAEVEGIIKRSGILKCLADLTIQVFFDEESGEPLADEPYYMWVSPGTTIQGRTDGDGWIRQQGLPPRDVEILFPRYSLSITGRTELVVPGDPIHENLGQATIHIEIESGADDLDHLAEKYRLYSTDMSYDETLSSKDDSVVGNNTVDLTFYNMNPALNYSLEVDPGGGDEKYLVFENVPFELIDAE